MKLRRLLFTGIAVVFVVQQVVCADDVAPATKPVTTAPATQVASTQTASTQPAVTLINMHLHKTLPEDAFAELAKQADVKITSFNNLWDQDGMQDEFDIDLKDRPFWSALDELCEACNVAPQFNSDNLGPYSNYNSSRRIGLMSTAQIHSPKVKPPRFEKDDFIVEALGFNRQQSLNYSAPESPINICSLQMRVFVDPGIHISSFARNIQATEAIDDQGHSMLLDNNGQNTTYMGSRQNSLVYNCLIPLKYPENAGKKIASLKFNVQLRGSATVDKLIVDQPLDASEVSKDFGETTVTFHSIKRGPRPGSYELKVGVMSDNDQPDSNMFGTLQSAQLLDAKGRAFNTSPGGGGGAAGAMEYTIAYSTNQPGMMIGTNKDPASGPPAKWVLEAPSKPHAIKFAAEFKDLALP